MKVTAGVLITAILSLVLAGHRRDLALLLTICVCCMVMIAAISYLSPVLDFAHRLIALGELDQELLQVLLKAAGIGMISQLAGAFCTDSGNRSLGNCLQFMTTAAILYICIPVLEQMLSLIETVLGEL